MAKKHSLGIVGRKAGMSRMFTEDGKSVPVTLIEATPNRITQIKTVDALVRAGLVLVARVLVDVRGHQDGVALDLGRQRDRAAHLRAGPLRRLDDLAGRTIDQAMIERLEPNPDLLVRHDGIPVLKERRAWRLGAPRPVWGKTKAGRLPGPPRRVLQTRRKAPPGCPLPS